MSEDKPKPVTKLRLTTHAIIGDATRPAGWEGEVDQDVAERMIEAEVAELANPPAPAPDSPHLTA